VSTIPKKIIDNSDVKLADFLNRILKEIPEKQLDIATAFSILKPNFYLGIK